MDTTGNLNRQIEALEQELKQKAARLSKLRAQKSQKERKQQRTADTRRKILAGAIVLKKSDNNPEFAAQLNQWLDEALTQERDRALFPALGQRK